MPSEELPELSDYSPESLDRYFSAVLERFHNDTRSVQSAEDQEQLRIRWVGRKQGLLARVSESLKSAPAEHKKAAGQRFNTLKAEVERGLASTPASTDHSAPGSISGGLHALAEEAIDVTLPGTRRSPGAPHPLITVMDEIVAVFGAMGYSIGLGPEVETDYYNFESLNFPPNHPARDTQDTITIADQQAKPLRERLLMRTHTSPVQIRTMERQPPPVRIVIPGKVHRNDAADATHSPIFHQVEGLCVDKGITFADLKGTLDHAMKALFGAGVKTRFFPSFFPFTEPSADVQISCIFCGGRGCRRCKQSGWIELLGCGMVDPAVFAFVREAQPDYDPEKISGFAFGMGVERIAMMKYGISEIGQFYSGDIRFLEQFR